MQIPSYTSSHSSDQRRRFSIARIVNARAERLQLCDHVPALTSRSTTASTCDTTAVAILERSSRVNAAILLNILSIALVMFAIAIPLMTRSPTTSRLSSAPQYARRPRFVIRGVDAGTELQQHRRGLGIAIPKRMRFSVFKVLVRLHLSCIEWNDDDQVQASEFALE